MQRRSPGLLLALPMLLPVLGSVGACSTVEPWERGVLARPHMASDPRPLRSALRAHVQTSRETAPPAGVGEGGLWLLLNPTAPVLAPLQR